MQTRKHFFLKALPQIECMGYIQSNTVSLPTYHNNRLSDRHKEALLKKSGSPLKEKEKETKKLIFFTSKCLCPTLLFDSNSIVKFVAYAIVPAGIA